MEVLNWVQAFCTFFKCSLEVCLLNVYANILIILVICSCSANVPLLVKLKGWKKINYSSMNPINC